MKDGYIVYFNPTGGFKAHVIATALAGFLVGAQVYYMHEEFKDLVYIPRLFYLPKGKRNRNFKPTVFIKKFFSGPEVEKLFQEFPR